jgi:hypothetical protein
MGALLMSARAVGTSMRAHQGCHGHACLGVGEGVKGYGFVPVGAMSASRRASMPWCRPNKVGAKA